MIFGNPSIFAIRADTLHRTTSVFRGHCNRLLYGSFCFQVSDTIIGDFDKISDLAASARWGRTFLSAARRRKRPDLDLLPSVEVFDLLYGRYVTDVNNAGAADAQVALDESLQHWDRDPYLLDEIGESSTRDLYALVVVTCANECDRLIIKSHNDNALIEHIVDRRVIDNVIHSFCAWVEEELKAEVE